MNLKARLSRAIKLSPPAIRLAALLFKPTGMAGSSRDYQRFVIAGYQRTGSTMLSSALASHPQACCYSEPYNYARPMLWTPGFVDDHPWLMAIRNQRPAAFLEHFLYRGYQPHIRAVGFKLFPEHVRDPRFRPVCEPLLTDPQVKVIHLTREDKLAMYVSRVRASRTGIWAIGKDASQRADTLELDADDCAAELARLEAQEDFFRQALAGREHIEVSYEQLSGDDGSQFSRIQHYLGLDPQPMQPHTAKQSRAPLSETVSNYHELRAHFQGTPWARYFAP